MDSKAIISEQRTRKTLLEYHKDPVLENLILTRLELMNTQKLSYESQIDNGIELLKRIKEAIKK